MAKPSLVNKGGDDTGKDSAFAILATPSKPKGGKKMPPKGKC